MITVEKASAVIQVLQEQINRYNKLLSFNSVTMKTVLNRVCISPDLWRGGGLRVSALTSGSSDLGSNPGRGQSVVFLSKTLHSHSASLTNRWVPTSISSREEQQYSNPPHGTNPEISAGPMSH